MMLLQFGGNKINLDVEMDSVMIKNVKIVFTLGRSGVGINISGGSLQSGPKTLLSLLARAASGLWSQQS